MSRSYPETKLCIAFVEHLETYFPRTHGILNYTHIANEGRNKRDGARLKKMGVHAGWFDYVFVWRNPSILASAIAQNPPQMGFLEAKIGKNSLSPTQKRFDDFMRPMDIPLEEFRTVEEGHNILIRWGLKPIRECRYFKEPDLATWDDKIAAAHQFYAPRKEPV